MANTTVGDTACVWIKAVCLLMVIKCTVFTKLLERLTGHFLISIASSHLSLPIILSISWAAGTKQTASGNIGVSQYHNLHLHKGYLCMVQSWYLLGKQYSWLACARISLAQETVCVTDCVISSWHSRTFVLERHTFKAKDKLHYLRDTMVILIYLQLLSTTLLEYSPK